MRTLSSITAPLLPTAPGQAFGRRPINSSAARMTCMVLFRHDEKGAMISVSDRDDKDAAVWLPKSMLGIAPRDRGHFLVVTISQALAYQHKLDLYASLIWDRYLPEVRALLKEAIDSAARQRRMLNGQRQTFSRCAGRDHFA